MGGRFWIVMNLAVLLGVSLAASADPSSSSPEVPTDSTSTSTTTTETSTTTTLKPTPPPSTTTSAPKTTTPVPETTTPVPKTTTPEPKTTTPEPKTTTPDPKTTTPAPITTTNVPSTTAVPDVKEGTWNVTDGNVTCILAKLKIEFTVNIGDQKYDIALSPDADSTGSTCHGSNDTQILQLSDQNYALTFEFAKESDSAFVKNVTFDYKTEMFYNDTRLFSVKNGNSYLCLSTETVSMGNSTMHIHSIHIQAFGGEGVTDFSTAEECEADDNISDVVPIAVACALAALIVVVLIAYLVGRRRNRQKGYTSV